MVNCLHNLCRLQLKIYLYILLILCNSNVTGQAVKSPVSSSFTLLNSFSKQHSDVFSFTNNTAALAHQKELSAGAYVENRYLLKALNLYSGVINVPTKQGNFGLDVDYFGEPNFNEYQLGLAYARPVGSNLDLGVQFNYYGYRIPGYQQASAVTFQLGAIAYLTDQLSVGIQIYNPIGGYLSKEHDEKLASLYQFGISYEPSESVIITGTVRKEEDRNINVIAGIFYQFDKRFFARAGIATENNSPFGAAGIAFKGFRIDLSVSYHPQLGFSPGFMFIYRKNKK